MSIFRSYFLKNNTLIGNNLSNNSQNPVTEVSYGTLNTQVSRFIFDVDFDDIRVKIADGSINPSRIVKHVLHMTNTIRYAQQYVGKKSYSLNIDRASSFDLELFNINQSWDEGSGYEFEYNDPNFQFVDVVDPVLIPQASNWSARTTTSGWTVQGAYISGVTQIIGTEHFEKGDEDIEIDITDYINQRIFGTGYTGTTTFTGSSYGLGIKFPDSFEVLETNFRQAVAFHAKHTNTYYEPYIETTIDDIIQDDRNYFYLDKDNDLFLYVNIGNFQQNVTVNQVQIFDYEDNLVATLTGSSIINVSKGVYKITLNVDSNTYPDAVLFKDVWTLTVNSRTTTFEGEFYLISQDKYYTFDQSNQMNFDNYYFYFWGINEKENVRVGTVRKIKLTIKELYANQNNFLPLDIEYRLFTTIGKKYELDLIPFTSVNRTNKGYEFNLDTSWLIPQDYYLQIRLKNGSYYENKQTLSFTVVSDGNLKA
ncbi:MAG: hypothetical protein WC428_00555 [Candidatus Paceibacterota bacterium]